MSTALTTSSASRAPMYQLSPPLAGGRTHLLRPGAPEPTQEQAHAHSLAAAAAAHQAAAAVAAAAAAGYVPLSAFAAHSLQANNYPAQLAAALQQAGPFSPAVTSHAAYLPAHLLHIYPALVDHSTTVSGSDDGAGAGGSPSCSPPQDLAALAARMVAPSAQEASCGEEYPPPQDWATHTSSLLTSLTAVPPAALLAGAAGGSSGGGGGAADHMGGDEACTSSPRGEVKLKHQVSKVAPGTKAAAVDPSGATPASSMGGTPTSLASFSRRPRKQARPLPCS
jgi:hypothetical protein